MTPAPRECDRTCCRGGHQLAPAIFHCGRTSVETTARSRGHPPACPPRPYVPDQPIPGYHGTVASRAKPGWSRGYAGRRAYWLAARSWIGPASDVGWYRVTIIRRFPRTAVALPRNPFSSNARLDTYTWPWASATGRSA